MGVGIGVSTVLFALVNGIVLRPLPYPEPDRLVRIFDTNLQAGIDRAGAASGNIDDWRRRASSFDGIAGFYAMGRTLSTETDAEVLITAQVSEDFFSLMRVPPLLGRTFSEEDTRRAAVQQRGGAGRGRSRRDPLAWRLAATLRRRSRHRRPLRDARSAAVSRSSA